VLDVISERVRARGTADGKTDGYKLGLVVEGGGMRGITSAVRGYFSNVSLVSRDVVLTVCCWFHRECFSV